jgi:GNAT superfamily N-acetyltransferase
LVEVAGVDGDSQGPANEVEVAAVLKDLSPGSLVQAIEENAADLMMEMGRVGGGHQRDEPNLRRTIGGSPIDYHNCVVKADLGPKEAGAAIQESAARMRLQGVPGSWHVGPSMRPRDLDARLQAAGFSYGGTEAGMAVDLHELTEEVPAAAGLAVERVRNRSQLSVWAGTLAQGFGEGAREANWVSTIFGRIGLGDDVPWRHYLARLDGTPVGTSSLFLGAGVAGIYFVMTVPEARRQGIGASVTLAGLREARAMGHRVGVLSSSKAGRSVYARLGFRAYCEIGLYEYGQQVGLK